MTNRGRGTSDTAFAVQLTDAEASEVSKDFTPSLCTDRVLLITSFLIRGRELKQGEEWEE